MHSTLQCILQFLTKNNVNVLQVISCATAIYQFIRHNFYFSSYSTLFGNRVHVLLSEGLFPLDKYIDRKIKPKIEVLDPAENGNSMLKAFPFLLSSMPCSPQPKTISSDGSQFLFSKSQQRSQGHGIPSRSMQVPHDRLAKAHDE